MTNVIPKLTQRTWLGQRGESGDQLLTSKTTGRRIAIHRWLEDGGQGKAGEVMVRAIDGDAWRDPDNFREYHSETLQDPSDEDIVAAMERSIKAIA